MRTKPVSASDHQQRHREDAYFHAIHSGPEPDLYFPATVSAKTKRRDAEHAEAFAEEENFLSLGTDLRAVRLGQVLAIT
ncbi:MAG: hypothetical protein J0M04_09325 [Verrucomicrobia bacterium]|nr:hypothetical protein [Verrucomicrobiota bacterium]